MKTLIDIVKSKHISLKLKMRTFTAFINSVMLYNSELWTVTKQMEEKINAFQRRQLRIILNRTWPKTISNEQLYTHHHRSRALEHHNQEEEIKMDRSLSSPTPLKPQLADPLLKF